MNICNVPVFSQKDAHCAVQQQWETAIEASNKDKEWDTKR